MQNINIGKLKKLDYSSEEAYKSLRTNLQFCGKDVKVISFTSCIPNEGKSSITINIARSMAETGKRILLIDADMRKSVLVGRHRISKGISGLSHFLSGYKELDDVLCMTNVPNLYMILAGPVPPNPSELLGSKSFRNLIRACKDKFDYIFIDNPPLGSVIDAAVTSQVSDGMCLVMSANEISYKFAQNVKEQMEKTNCRILGVILNKVQLKKNGYYGKYYGKYYGRYYGNEEGDRL